MESITLASKKFSYTITKKSISSIRLKLESSRSFTISCPRLTPAFVINQFIKNNQNWIISHSSKITPKKLIKNLQKINILGQAYQLIFTSTQFDSVLVFETDRKIYVNVSKNTNIHIKKVLEKKLRPLAFSLIKRELSFLENKFGFKYGHITVRNQKSRFGSCSSQGNLNFNWQIIFFPYDEFCHILLHELTHLKIKNHSKTFWDQLTIYDPDCHKHNLWLRKEGTKLFIF